MWRSVVVAVCVLCVIALVIASLMFVALNWLTRPEPFQPDPVNYETTTVQSPTIVSSGDQPRSPDPYDSYTGEDPFREAPYVVVDDTGNEIRHDGDAPPPVRVYQDPSLVAADAQVVVIEQPASTSGEPGHIQMSNIRANEADVAHKSDSGSLAGQPEPAAPHDNISDGDKDIAVQPEPPQVTIDSSVAALQTADAIDTPPARPSELEYIPATLPASYVPPGAVDVVMESNHITFSRVRDAKDIRLSVLGDHRSYLVTSRVLQQRKHLRLSTHTVGGQLDDGTYRYRITTLPLDFNYLLLREMKTKRGEQFPELKKSLQQELRQKTHVRNGVFHVVDGYLQKG